MLVGGESEKPATVIMGGIKVKATLVQDGQEHHDIIVYEDGHQGEHDAVAGSPQES